MSKNHIKARNVNLIMGGTAIGGSDSCDITYTLNTAQAAAKSDVASGLWDNPEPTYYDWQANNESFIIGASHLTSLISAWNAGTPVTVKFQIDGQGGWARQGSAIITNLSITSQMDDYAKVTLSFDGAGALSVVSDSSFSYSPASGDKIRGKAIMVAINTSQTSTPSWHTIACATNHTMELSHQLGDVRCKDINDLAPNKEITGNSCKITTENLVALNEEGDTAITLDELETYLREGATVALQIGYYSGAVGHEDEDWGGATTVFLSGNFLVTSFNISGQGTQEDATFKAEFSNKGAVSFS